MSKVLFLFVLFFSKQLLAADLMLEKHVTSGLMIPENSFRKSCTISENGQLESATYKGDGTAISLTKILPIHTRQTLKQLVRLSSKGKILEDAVICDSGNKMIYGYHKGKTFVLKELFDCSSNSYNTHKAVTPLLKLFYQLCGF